MLLCTTRRTDLHSPAAGDRHSGGWTFPLEGNRHAHALRSAIPLQRHPADGAQRGVSRAVTTPVLDLDGRMVDRRRELTELRTAVATAERVSGGCVLLSGSPGVGKSTLMQALGIEISRRSCVFAYGRSEERRVGK